jgi:hypothetical protein
VCDLPQLDAMCCITPCNTKAKSDYLLHQTRPVLI